MITLKKHSEYVRIGSFISGRWHRNKYKVVRKLGSGAVGTVYLVESVNKRLAALKISDHSTAMTTEVNVLKSLNKVQGQKLGPYLLDVDDWHVSSNLSFSFYVMEYIEGMNLQQFVRRTGTKQIGILFLSILLELEKIHQLGWIFGDLKLENIIVQQNPLQIRLIDVGGVTKKGRAIKEYTEFNDRGYWNLGSRKADEAYDLFALVMLFVNIFYPKKFTRKENNLPLIMDYISRVKPLRPYMRIFRKSLLGKYSLASEMKKDLIPIVKRERKRQTTGTNKNKNNQVATFWFESIGLSTIGVVYYLVAKLLGV